MIAYKCSLFGMIFSKCMLQNPRVNKPSHELSWVSQQLGSLLARLVRMAHCLRVESTSWPARLAPHFARLGSALLGSVLMLAEPARLFANPDCCWRNIQTCLQSCIPSWQNKPHYWYCYWYVSHVLLKWLIMLFWSCSPRLSNDQQLQSLLCNWVMFTNRMRCEFEILQWRKCRWERFWHVQNIAGCLLWRFFLISRCLLI